MVGLLLGLAVKLWVRRTSDRELRADGLEPPVGPRIEETLIPAVIPVMMILALARWGWASPKALFFGSFLLWLVPISAVDLRTQIIPDEMILGGLTTGGLILAVFQPFSFSDGLIGLAAGFGLMLVLALIGRGAIGGGDVKLGALLGLHLGWPAVLAGLTASFIAGSAAALFLLLFRIKGRRDFIPYGPFFAVGSAVVLFLA